MRTNFDLEEDFHHLGVISFESNIDHVRVMNLYIVIIISVVVYPSQD